MLISAIILLGLAFAPTPQVEPKREPVPQEHVPQESAKKIEFVLHVLDDETGAELDGISLATFLHPILPAKPLGEGTARGADGATTGLFRSPVTIQFEPGTNRRHVDKLFVRATGHVSDVVDVDWDSASELTIRLARRAEIRVNVEGLVIPRVEPPSDMSEEMFEVTIRPHLAVRSLAPHDGVERFGGPRKRPAIVDELLAMDAPASLSAELHEEFLASVRLRAAQALTAIHEPSHSWPLDDEGTGVIEGIAPGRWLVTVDVHPPFDDEIDNRVHRFEWMTGKGGPIAALAIDVTSSGPNSATLRVPRPVVDEAGSVKLRFRDVQTGSSMRLEAQSISTEPLLRRTEHPRTLDTQALRAWWDPYQKQWDDGDLALAGPAGFVTLYVTPSAAPWFEPMQTWLNLSSEPREVEIPLERATGLLVRWRGEHGPIDVSTLDTGEQRSFLAVSLTAAEGEEVAPLRCGRGEFTLFCVPRPGRWTLNLPDSTLFTEPATRSFDLEDRRVVETVVEVRVGSK